MACLCVVFEGINVCIKCDIMAFLVCFIALSECNILPNTTYICLYGIKNHMDSPVMSSKGIIRRKQTCTHKHKPRFLYSKNRFPCFPLPIISRHHPIVIPMEYAIHVPIMLCHIFAWTQSCFHHILTSCVLTTNWAYVYIGTMPHNCTHALTSMWFQWIVNTPLTGIISLKNRTCSKIGLVSIFLNWTFLWTLLLNYKKTCLHHWVSIKIMPGLRMILGLWMIWPHRHITCLCVHETSAHT